MALFCDADSFNPSLLDEIILKHKRSSIYNRSRAVSRYFESLSILAETVLPDKLTKFLMLCSCKSNSFNELQTLMKYALQITDRDSLFNFLEEYVKKVPKSHNSTFMRYFVAKDAPSLRGHLAAGHATHMDVNNLVMAVKRGTLIRLSDLAFKFSFQPGAMKQDILANQLCQYEWICKLSTNQEKIKQYIDEYESSSKSELNHDDLEDLFDKVQQLIGVDLINQPLRDVMQSLKNYSLIEYQDDNAEQLVIKAYNLSLKDALNFIVTNKWNIEKYEAIHFLCIDSFYIDTSVNWESKNLVIVASSVIVVAGSDDHDLTIDVSGHGFDATTNMPGEAGQLYDYDESDEATMVSEVYEVRHQEDETGDNGGADKVNEAKDILPPKVVHGRHGINGRHGKPGMSGGNILICTDEIVNLDKLLLISCGGAGSDGHNGGNGQDGVALQGKSDADPSQYVNLKKDPHDQKKIMINSSIVFPDEIRRKLETKYTVDDKTFRNGVPMYSSSKANCFAYGVSKCPRKTEILVGMVVNDVKVDRFGYVYCKSKQGESANGGNAGIGGMGGEGGYAGRISIRDKFGLHENTLYMKSISIYADRGKNGKSGKPGSVGKNQRADYTPDNLLAYSSSILKPIAATKGKTLFECDDTTIQVNIFRKQNCGKTVTKRSKYYCPAAVSRPFLGESNCNEYIKFCEATDHDMQCIRNYLKNCQDGKIIEQNKVQQSESSKMVDLQSVAITFQLFLNEKQHIVLNNMSRFARDFENLAQFMNDQLQELASCEQAQQHVKQHKKFDTKSQINDSTSAFINMYQVRTLSLAKPTCEWHHNCMAAASLTDEEQDCQPSLAICQRILPDEKLLKSKVAEAAVTSCNVFLPLAAESKAAIELLMIFINEIKFDNNTALAFLGVPNLIHRLQLEYDTYGSTITDYDFFFVMNFILNILDQQLNKFKFETLLSLELLQTPKAKLCSYGEKNGYIFYKRKTYVIDRVKQLPAQEQKWTVSCFQVDLQNTRVLFAITNNQILFDNEVIKNPEAVRISRVNISELWEYIQIHLIKYSKKPNEEEVDRIVDRFLYHDDISERCKHKFKRLLNEGCSALCEFSQLKNIFSLYLPTSWVEQLILAILLEKFPNLFTKIRQFITGLSCSADKTLYCTFFALFINSEDASHHTSGELEKEIIKALQIMKKIFIEQNVCSLVTKQGIAETLEDGHDIKAALFEELRNDELIDCTGIFSPDVTIHDLKSFCENKDFAAGDATMRYFSNTLNLQKLIQKLSSNTSLTLWLHELYNLYFCLILQTCTVQDITNNEFDKIMVHMYELKRRNNANDILKFMNHLYKINKPAANGFTERLPINHLMNLLEMCATDQHWLFPIFLKHFLQSASPMKSLSTAPDFLTDENRENAQNYVLNEIVDFIRPHVENESHMESVLEHTKKLLIRIKQAEKNHAYFDNRDRDSSLEESDFGLGSIKICNYNKWHIAHWVDIFKVCTDIKVSDNDLVQAFAVIRRGITLFYKKKEIHGVLPRDTQMVASLLFCQNLSDQGGADQGTKLMQQISTGEGKTLIICMVAIYKALFKKKVDIVTSSSVLAKRDAKNQKPLYDLFEVSVSHCCHEDLAKRRKSYKADVIYGDIGSFQRDILETDFYDRQIRVGRTNDTVFVDEVDSMLVDKGENMLYLPHPIPEMSSLDQIYLEIWLKVNSKDFLGLKGEQEQIYAELRQKIFGSIASNTIFSTILDVDEDLSKKIFHCLQDNKVIDQDCFINWELTSGDIVDNEDSKKKKKKWPWNRVMPDSDVDVDDTADSYIEKHDKVNTNTNKKLLEIISPIKFFIDHNLPINEIFMILQQHKKDNQPLIPKTSSLYKYVKMKLPSWIQSAINAKYFQENKEYIVDIDRRESATNRYPKIIIMDNETGVEQESAEWGDGLHQFLQLKHNLRLTTESLKAVYMSNISFFSRYVNLFGVTGTLGSSEECCLFSKLYKNTKILVIPTHRPSKLTAEIPMYCSTLNEWETAIEQDLKEKLVQKGRVVLLICRDKKSALDLEKSISSKQWFSQAKEIKKEMYFSSHQEEPEQKGEFDSKQLIIATNIAGRGTDIKLSKEVIKKGGLHVLLSFLPANLRVELQGYGRAARGGEPGSCKMIFHEAGAALKNNLTLSDCIRKRDSDEASRVADIEKDYFHNIKFQEELFNEFRQWYLSEPLKKLERVYLDQALDNWAFFLDGNGKLIESIPNMVDSEIEKKLILQSLRKEVTNIYGDHSNIKSHGSKLSHSRLLQLAHTKMKREAIADGVISKVSTEVKAFLGRDVNYEKSIKLYREVLKQDPLNPFAQYYLASAKFNKKFKTLAQVQFSEGELELKPWKTSTYKDKTRRKLKQSFYQIIPLFKNKILKCQIQARMLEIANMQQDRSITAGSPHFQEQKEHEIEVYNYFISTMENVTGRNITEESIASLNLGEDATLILWKWIMTLSDKNVYAKKLRIAKNHEDRLKLMLFTQSLYYTYDSRIKKKMKSLTSAARSRDKPWEVTQKDFIGTLPDQTEFWDTLVSLGFITCVEKDEESGQIKWGYWNPTKTDLDTTNFPKEWFITEESFDWIDGLTLGDKETIIQRLTKQNIINERGRLIDFNLTKPLDIPMEFNLHYKAVKDTLLYHCVNWFVLDHLSESCEIQYLDYTESSHYTGTTAKHRQDEVAEDESSKSVLEVLISMNSQANVSHPLEVQHITMPASSGITGEAELDADSFYGCLTEHVPNEEMNHRFLKQMQQHNLQITYVSGNGLNCLINALIQHSKQDYSTPSFIDHATNIRRRLREAFSDINVNGMLHCDDEVAAFILQMVNDISVSTTTKIYQVSVVMASSDGPIIYGGTSDDRYALSGGRHVVLWQQGFHYVPIVHSQDFYDSLMCSQLTSSQLRKLEQLNIVFRSKKRKSYEICKSVEQIFVILDPAHQVFHPQECHNVCQLLKEKLKVDFLTLNNSESIKHFLSNTLLFNDLGKYFVIKGIKMKLTVDDLKEQLGVLLNQNTNLVKKLFLKEKPIDVNWSSINDHLESKNIEKFEGTALKVWKKLPAESLPLTLEQLLVLVQSTEHDIFSEKQKKAIETYIKVMHKLKNNFQLVTEALHDNAVSCLLQLETPLITLRALEHVFEEGIQEKEDVVRQFTDNQCDFTISLGEKKWSTRMLIRSGIVIGLGAAQILAGVGCMWLPGIGTYFGDALLGEGINDIVFAIAGLVKGHVTWKQYFTSKGISLLFTAGFGLLGPLAQFGLKGTILSKYAYKAFGNPKGIAKLPIDLFMKKAAKAVSVKVAKNVSLILAKSATNSVAINAIQADLFLKHTQNYLISGIDFFIDSAVKSFDYGSKKVYEKILELMKGRQVHNDESNRSRAKKCFSLIFNKVMMHLLNAAEKAWVNVEKTVKQSLIDLHGLPQLLAFILNCERSVRENADLTALSEEILDSINLSNELNKLEKSAKGQQSFDETEMNQIMNHELQEIRSTVKQRVSHRGRLLQSNCDLLIAQHLIDLRDKEQNAEDDHDMVQLSEYEKALNADQHDKKKKKRQHASKALLQYESMMKRLMSNTRSPQAFTKMIEHHDTLLIPAFAVPLMENKLNHPIIIVNKKSFKLLKSSKEGKPLTVTFSSTTENDYGSFSVNGEEFTFKEYGNNCLLFAITMAAPYKMSYLPYELRKEIADSWNPHLECCDSPYNQCIEFRLVGAGKLIFPRDVYQFLSIYASKVLKLSSLDQLCKQKFISKKELRELGFQVTHIMPIQDIKEFVLEALKMSRNMRKVQLNRILALLPSSEQVLQGTSLLGEQEGKEAFLEVYQNNELYEKRVCKAKDIVDQWIHGKCMTSKSFEILLSILNSAPANLFLDFDSNSSVTMPNAHHRHCDEIIAKSLENINLHLYGYDIKRDHDQQQGSLFQEDDHHHPTHHHRMSTKLAKSKDSQPILHSRFNIPEERSVSTSEKQLPTSVHMPVQESHEVMLDKPPKPDAVEPSKSLETIQHMQSVKWPPKVTDSSNELKQTHTASSKTFQQSVNAVEIKDKDYSDVCNRGDHNGVAQSRPWPPKATDSSNEIKQTASSKTFSLSVDVTAAAERKDKDSIVCSKEGAGGGDKVLKIAQSRPWPPKETESSNINEPSIAMTTHTAATMAEPKEEQLPFYMSFLNPKSKIAAWLYAAKETS